MDNIEDPIIDLAQTINMPERSELEKLPSVNSSEPPLPPASKKNKMSKATFYKMMGILVILVFIILLILFFFLNKQSKNNNQGNNNNSEETNEEEREEEKEQEENNEEETIDTEKDKRIAYIDEGGNVFVIKPDGSSLLQVTNDAGESEEAGFYRNLYWINSKELAFFVCTGVKKCEIKKFNIETEKLTSVKTIAANLGTFGWSPDGKDLVYLTFNDEFARELFLNDKKIAIWEEEAGGRGGIPDDNTGIYWSPDGKYFALNYTGSVPVQQGVYIYDKGGNELDSLDTKEDFNFATFPVWYSNNSLYFKREAQILQYTVGGAEKAVVSDIAAYNLSLLDKKVAYWDLKNEEKQPDCYIYNLDTKKTSKIDDDIHKCAWLDIDTLIGLSTIESDAFLTYDTEALVRIEEDGTEFKKLFDGFVVEFSIN